jgi:hypothetical protein
MRFHPLANMFPQSREIFTQILREGFGQNPHIPTLISEELDITMGVAVGHGFSFEWLLRAQN